MNHLDNNIMSRKTLFLVSDAVAFPDILYPVIVRAALGPQAAPGCTCFGIKAANRGFSWESCSPHLGYSAILLASFFKASLSVRQVDEVWKFLILNGEGGGGIPVASLANNWQGLQNIMQRFVRWDESGSIAFVVFRIPRGICVPRDGETLKVVSLRSRAHGTTHKEKIFNLFEFLSRAQESG